MLLVPSAAVVDGHVFRNSTASAPSRKVETGIRARARSRSQSGLKEGDIVVASCRTCLADGPGERGGCRRHEEPGPQHRLDTRAHSRAADANRGFGVATGVGFSIMMASLMEGSQDDFVKTLVNVLPHVTISDERNRPTLQPGEQRYSVAEIHGLTPEVRRRGIKNPMATVASLEAWVPGSMLGQLEGLIATRSRRFGFHTGIDRSPGERFLVETDAKGDSRAQRHPPASFSAPARENLQPRCATSRLGSRNTDQRHRGLHFHSACASTKARPMS